MEAMVARKAAELVLADEQRAELERIVRAQRSEQHQVRSWLTSIDPEFETKQADVCGLYLNPPEGAIVVSLDEKTSIQAKEPIRSELPLEPGKPARREFEDKRHGTVAPLAALLVHTGEVKGEVYERNSRVEFLDFLERLEAEIPTDKRVHAILDNLQVHKTPEVAAWLEAHPRWRFHFTPRDSSRPRTKSAPPPGPPGRSVRSAYLTAAEIEARAF
jgi:hypothetical protein